MKASYCVLVHRAVEVGGALFLGLALVIARLHPGLRHVDAVEIDDGRDGVEKRQRLGPGFVRDRLGQLAEVSGPVAMIQWPSSGSSVISPYSTVILGCAISASVTDCAKGSRSTASAPPAGRRCLSAVAMINPFAARISQCSRPTAFCSLSSERKELEQTISPSKPGLVGKGADLGAHFVDHDLHARVRGLPCGLGPGHAAAHDMKCICHGAM